MEATSRYPIRPEGALRLERFGLEGGDAIWRGRLPEACIPSADRFDALWEMRPEQFPRIMMHGRRVALPRWQRAYGRDYEFSGTTSRAAPLDGWMREVLGALRGALKVPFNGALLNWYDGRLGHYIGPHRDSIKGLVEGAPIVNCAFGEARAFRLDRIGGGRWDLMLEHGELAILAWAVNKAYKHSVPKTKRARARRISLTARAFLEPSGEDDP